MKLIYLMPYSVFFVFLAPSHQILICFRPHSWNSLFYAPMIKLLIYFIPLSWNFYLYLAITMNLRSILCYSYETLMVFMFLIYLMSNFMSYSKRWYLFYNRIIKLWYYNTTLKLWSIICHNHGPLYIYIATFLKLWSFYVMTMRLWFINAIIMRLWSSCALIMRKPIIIKLWSLLCHNHEI